MPTSPSLPHRLGQALGLACTLVLLAGAASADDLDRLRLPVGELIVADGQVVGESFDLPAALPAVLAAMPTGGRLDLLELPLAPGVRRGVRLRQVDLYAPGARIWHDDGKTLRELPRSQRRYFLGADPADPTWRIGLWLDPATGHLGGVSAGPDGTFDLARTATGARLTRTGHDVETESHCANGPIHRADAMADPGLPRGPLGDLAPAVARSAKGAAMDPTYQVTIAVDTDNEFLWKRFGNDVGAAADWVVELFVALNTIYERDLDLHLVQGETFLRTDSGNPPNYDADPWTASSPTGALFEIDDVWRAEPNLIAVDRVFVTFLSGKLSSGFSFSGVAWVGPSTYCSTTVGYNVNQTFHHPGVGISSHATFVGHEIGHNAGSPHTHCYSPTVDQCWNSEDGCWTGSTSCPAGGGTIMSYCHLAGCPSSPLQEFHPTVQARIEGYLPGRYPFCVVDYEIPGAIFDDGFEAENTGGWDGVLGLSLRK